MSAKYGLSKRYINHCVRVKSLQIFYDEQIPGRHIMCVRVHKSETFFKSYGRKLSSSRKHAISDTFSRATGVLEANNASPSKKTTKTTKLLSQMCFHPNTSQAESSNFKSFQFCHCHPW